MAEETEPEHRPPPRRQLWQTAIPTLLIGLWCFWLADSAATWTGFNPDESRWISRSHYLADLKDPTSPTWDDQYMTRGQPPLGSYAMGAGLLLQGRDLETNPPWDFALPWEENLAVGNKPVPGDLAAGRRTSAVLVALTAITLIAVARVFVPLPWALVAGALFASHPFTAYIGSIAMADALFGLLIALAALAAAALGDKPGWPRALLLGALLGLGAATKLSPLAVAFGLSAGSLVLLALGWRPMWSGRSAVRPAMYGVGIGFAAIGVFVAVYPYLWPDPIGRTRNLFVFRTEEMAAQAADWPVMAVSSRGEAIQRVGVNFAERFSLTGSAASLLDMVPAPLLPRLEVTIAAAGIIAMIARAARAGPFSSMALVLAVLGGQALVTLLAMRSEFDRYHLPMALLGSVSAVVALDWVGRWIHGRAGAGSRSRGSRWLTPPGAAG